ncbi:polyamine transport [Fusarium heterosporum]|uniref:Polyamine transport n=1 Tax=Fusarium heterosporum TaxID=42747 RepID=A0A8H5TC11_FUSHE|nr:polyamine transport [Fusarium heterosporum]
MFSALIGHTRASLPHEDSEGYVAIDAGDFDRTPPPSNRASLDMSRNEDEESDITKESGTDPDATPWYQTLEIQSNSSKIASRDDQVSPILDPPSKTQPGMLSIEGLSATRGPPYQKTDLSRDGPISDTLRTRSLKHSQDTHGSKVTTALTNLPTSINSFNVLREELQFHPSPQLNSIKDLGENNGAREIGNTKGNSGNVKTCMSLGSDSIGHQKQNTSNQLCCEPGHRPNGTLPSNTEVDVSPDHNTFDKGGGKGGSSAGSNEQLANTISSEVHMDNMQDRDEVPPIVGVQVLSTIGDQELSTACTGRPERSRSSGSVLDYLWKSSWLRRLSNTARSNSLQLTDLPPRTKSVRANDRCPSEPLLPSSTTLRRLSVWSNISDKSGDEVDGPSFNRTFDDLEKVLDDALSLALVVADHSEATTHSENNLIPDNSRCINESEELAIRGTEEKFEVPDIGGEDNSYLVRPEFKRAATTRIPERPRLADVVENYSGTYKELRTRTYFKRRQYKSSSRLISRSGRSGRQGQAVKAYPKHEIVLLRDLLNPSTLVELGPEGEDDQDNSTIHQQSSVVNVSSGVRSEIGHDALPDHDIAGRRLHKEHGVHLRRRSHVSLRDTQGFSLPKSHIRQPIARDWSPVRKRFVASVACLSTALIGVLLGIYSGLVPSIQYYIVDQSHVAIHGNTGCFLALALPSFFLWPLPLLHGRKPYIMSSFIIAMPLLFPQAIAVSSQRLTNTTSWRVLLLVSRTLMGGSLGFASMNFHSVLTDLFGASLMCRHPHQEVVDQYDARRHGGGMGLWLGIWTWCWIGSLGLGFLIGAAIIDKHPPAWGFYISIMMIAVVLILNVACPEVRRSAFRRSIAEVRTGGEISRRLARGEITMHRIKTGPKWWGQEAYHGVRLSLEMLEQPGFAVMALYVAWIYAQVVLVIILLGSLVSRSYRLRSPYVGLHVAAIALGAVLAIPFQKASVFSRSRHREGNSNRETITKKVVWSSHLIRRATFTIALPIGGACYTAVSSGPPISSGAPAFFALGMGFLSCLAIAECNGLIMETFDTSDLTPGMVARHRDPSGQDQRRTNYSSYPRVTAGFAIIHSFSYILAAGSTALGGHVTRKLGQQVATSIVAGILFLLTVLLLLVLIRFKNVLIIPRSKSEEMEKITQARRKSTKRRASMPYDLRARMEEDYAWRPVMTGNPVGKNRRMNVLEMGNLTRWQDIRRRNKLIDAGVHLNRDTLGQGLDALDVALENHVNDMRQNAHGFFRRGSLRRHGSRIRRSNQSSEQTFHDMELDMLDPTGTPSESSQRPRQFVERECVMGQTIKEENKDEAQARSSSFGKIQA